MQNIEWTKTVLSAMFFGWYSVNMRKSFWGKAETHHKKFKGWCRGPGEKHSHLESDRSGGRRKGSDLGSPPPAQPGPNRPNPAQPTSSSQHAASPSLRPKAILLAPPQAGWVGLLALPRQGLRSGSVRPRSPSQWRNMWTASWRPVEAEEKTECLREFPEHPEMILEWPALARAGPGRYITLIVEGNHFKAQQAVLGCLR